MISRGDWWMKEFIVNEINGAAVRRDACSFDCENGLGNAVKRHRDRHAVFKLASEIRISRGPAAANVDPGPNRDLCRKIPEDPNAVEMWKAAIVEIADSHDGRGSGYQKTGNSEQNDDKAFQTPPP